MLSRMGLGVGGVTTGKGVGDGAPSWVPSGSSFYDDFINTQYWDDGNGETTLPYTDDRDTAAWAYDSDGEIVEFATDVARVTDRGLTVEPAATNLTDYADVFSNAIWAKNNVTVSQDGDWWEVNDAIVSAHHRIQSGTAQAPVVATNAYTISALIQPQNGRRYFCFRSDLKAVGGSFENIGFDIDGSGSVTYTPSGWTASVTKTGDSYLITASVTATVTAATSGVYGLLSATSSVTSDTLPTYNAVATTLTHRLRFMQFEAGTTATTFVETAGTTATRNADDIDRTLPTGTHDITITFDDDSTQLLEDQTGTWTIPTDLDRDVIKSIRGQRVSPL